jgi:hypothetical protein
MRSPEPTSDDRPAPAVGASVWLRSYLAHPSVVGKLQTLAADLDGTLFHLDGSLSARVLTTIDTPESRLKDGGTHG